MIREKRIKARKNNRKRPCLVQRTNENKKEKRRRINKCPVVSAVWSMVFDPVHAVCIIRTGQKGRKDVIR